MTGFQCIDESAMRHSVSVLNEENYSDLHEAKNYNIHRLQLPHACKTESDDNESEKEIVADKKSFTSFYTTHSTDNQEDESDCTSSRKHLVNIETWSNGIKDEPLKSPKLLKEMISNFEDHDLLYKVPKSSTKNTYEEEEYVYEPEINASSTKMVTRCRSLLNLQLQSDTSAPNPSTISKATSEMNLQNNKICPKQQDKERITKTISVMLEKRRQQVAAAQNPHVTKEPSTQNSFTNEELVNENVVLVEPLNIHTLDRSCRVTGEILKDKSPSCMPGTYSDYHRNVCTLPRTTKSHRMQLQRHFYYPLKSTKSSTRVLDEELPDPDKVKHARELFERVLKVSSLENVNGGTNNSGRPRSPKKEHWSRPTPEIRQPQDSPIPHAKLHKCFSVDTSHQLKHLTLKWTDNGSMSSGVGSDISAETDIDKGARCHNGSNSSSKEDIVFTSDEDLSNSHDMEEMGKPITQDALNSIRAYGTSVTYYGGKIIASNKGYTCSPMTMTIMNEIRQASPDYQVNRKFLFDDMQQAKFKLIKSNSCGSRLELSGTEEYRGEHDEKPSILKEHSNNNEARRENDTIKEEEEEDQIRKKEALHAIGDSINSLYNKPPQKLKKNWMMNGQQMANGKSYCDMEFEEFEILEDKS